MSKNSKDTIDLDYLFELTQLITNLSEDVTVKGAVILASQAYLEGMQDNFRMTTDIDFNFKNGNMPLAVHLVQTAVNLSSKSGIVKPEREDSKSGALEVLGLDGTLLAQLDVQFKDTMFKVNYSLPNGGYFRGQSLELILADKLAVVSSSRGVLPRRIKDLFDIYFICSIYSINYQSVLRHLHLTGRELGNFAVLLDYKNETKSGIKHAYNSYRGIRNKPDFSIVVAKVLVFCEPFMRKYQGQTYWDRGRGKWS